MPWTTRDVDRHKAGLGPKQKERWVAIANSALSDCLKKGGSAKTCEGRAIRIANAGAVREADETGIIYYGHTPEIMRHNVEVLTLRGYEKEVAQDIASQIAGMPMPSEEQPVLSATASVASASNTVSQTA